ncbi:hypothetical protein [Magnetococcus sp. PR-3]|uniref:hypothetical protein n=1 Tax=Magnetococcus sp. PR-3 TaxID=3120355 RepID=UPI002FCE179E
MSAQVSTALLVLRTEESKQLIGQAVAQLPQVQSATHKGHMVVVGGGTTRYVAQALTGQDPTTEHFAIGWIHEGALGETDQTNRGPGPFIWENGQTRRGWPADVLQNYGAGDIYIKGANALDVEGNVGILMGSPTGGTIGAAYTILLARGAELIVPVSLEKLIPGSVFAAAGLLGQQRIDRVMGDPVGMMPIHHLNATVVTEITACALLYRLKATAVSAGGVEDCRGGVTLHVEGHEADIEQLWLYLQRLRA